jgi:vacuolar-type H+-ATPase subunit I/STV1
MVGTKKKNGKEVPNCVPKNEGSVTEAEDKRKIEKEIAELITKRVQTNGHKRRDDINAKIDALKDKLKGLNEGTTMEGQQTYSAWKAALKKKHGAVEFEGDKDIAQAFVKKDGKRVGVGEWDGESGRVDESYKKGDTVKVPHKGKMVSGKVVRTDTTGPESDFCVVDVGEEESIKVPVSKVKSGSLGEAAVDATVFGGDQPYDAVDDQQQKDERTGRADRVGTKVEAPREVMSSIDKRITELKKSVERYDNNGYNEKSVKHSAIECLEQIKKNLGRGDHEGFMEAQIFFGTLMSPIWDMFPGQLVNYLATGDDSK